VNSLSPFILCDIKFANTHYLLSEKEMKQELLVLRVDENFATTQMRQVVLRFLSLISNNNMDVVLLSEVKKLAEKKFGSLEGLAEEKTKRAAKSEANWITKCVIARVHNTKEPPMPDLVRRENNKANPHVC
jgi:hypothetical protein